MLIHMLSCEADLSMLLSDKLKNNRILVRIEISETSELSLIGVATIAIF